MRSVLSRGVVVLLVALFAVSLVSTAAAIERHDKYQTEPAKKLVGDEPAGKVPANPVGRSVFSALDEQVGDTLVICNNYRDQQHNSAYGRMIAVDNTGDLPVFMVAWTQHNNPTVAGRYVGFTRILDNGDGTFTVEHPSGSQVGVTGAGYTSIAIDFGGTMGSIPNITHHEPRGDGEYRSAIYRESDFVPDFFSLYEIPRYQGTLEGIWPQNMVAEYDGSVYSHAVINGYADPQQDVYYHRAVYDPGTSTWSNATPGDVNQVLINEYQETIGTIVVASDDGSKVTLGQPWSRWLGMGEGGEWDGLALSQGNNDIYLYQSEDGGASFDWENPVNVTQFIAPDPSLLPDTTAANQDTLRAYAEVDLHYDGDDRLHVMFNTHILDYYRETLSYTARMFYWNDDHQMYTQVADGTFWNYAIPRAWERIVSHGQTYKDDDTGILWATWVQYGDAGDTLYVEEDEMTYPLDASDEAYANSDIYVSASPDNGLHWSKGINVTNTRTMEVGLEAGECQSENDPSLAHNNDGDYLYLFYNIDFDAGISEVPGQEEAEITNNEMVFHRINKQELLTLIEDQGEWQVNYPLHVDGTGYYEDPNDWEWDGFWGPIDSVEGAGELTPDQFELNQNYPNPFNPSTSIQFTLQAAGDVKLAVYDVLGREVATLVDRQMNAGAHSVTFLAEDLSSGVYFYKLTSGSAEKVRKMVLMK